ncbi:chitinase, partial [Streptomyces sp. Ncost-T6T-2b]
MLKLHRPRARLRALAAAACTAALGATLLGVAGTSPAGATPTAESAAATAKDGRPHGRRGRQGD